MSASLLPPRAVGGVAVVGIQPPAHGDHSHGLGLKGKDIASAATLQLGPDGSFFHVTGTTTITSLSARPAGDLVFLEFDGALTLTYNATSLILVEGANRTTVAKDTAVFVSEGVGNWRELGRSLGGSPTLTGLTVSGTLTLSGTSGKIDLSAISAGNPNFIITGTSDTPAVTWPAATENNLAAGKISQTAPAGYLEITVGGSSRYIPYWA